MLKCTNTKPVHAGRSEPVLDLLIAFDTHQRFYEQRNYYNRLRAAAIGDFNDDEDAGGWRAHCAH